MTDSNRTPGPWDRSDAPPAPRHEPEVEAARRPAPTESLIKGQNPIIAVVGTGLFLAFIWFLTGSWVIAVAVIFGLLVHEYGHVLAMNKRGMGPARIFIIPFLGGVAQAQRGPKSEWDGVVISLAGPLFGLLATIPFFALFLWNGEPIWIMAVFVICMINLINLAPAPPLDGSKALGPVLAKVHPKLELAVVFIIGLIVASWAISRGSYIFGIFVALALFGHLKQGPRAPYGRKLSGKESGMSVGLFAVTAAACVAVAVGAVTLLTGDPVRGFGQVLRYFGI